MITYQWYLYPNHEDAKIIRTRVFCEEQGFSTRGEFDETDKTARHLVAYQGGQPVGTGRIFSDDGAVWHIGRVAVLSECRGLHLGAGLMKEMEAEIRRLGGKSITLGAQVQARGFYASLGYAPQGEEYMDEHCPHVDMVKEL